MSRYWRRILVVNAVTAVAAFGLFGGFQSSPSWPVAAQSFLVSFIFANCIGSLMGFVMPRLCTWIPVRGAAARWIVRFGAILVVTAGGLAMAGVVLMAIGWIDSGQYLGLMRR